MLTLSTSTTTQYNPNPLFYSRGLLFVRGNVNQLVVIFVYFSVDFLIYQNFARGEEQILNPWLAKIIMVLTLENASKDNSK